MMRAIVFLGVVLIACSCATVRHETSPEPTESAGAVSVEFRLARRTPAPGFIEHGVLGSAGRVYVSPTAELTEQDVQSAEVVGGVRGPGIELILTPTGAKRFADVTASNIDEMLAVLVDGQVVSSPTIREPIEGGRVRIVGTFTEQEAARIASALSKSEV